MPPEKEFATGGVIFPEERHEEDVPQKEIEQKNTAQLPEEKSPEKRNVPETGERTWLKALRTYKSDVSEALKKQKGSLTRIVIEEKKKKEKEKTTPPSPRKQPVVESQRTPIRGKGPYEYQQEKPRSRFPIKNIVIITLSFLLVVTGIGAAYGAFLILSKTKTPSPFEFSNGIITTEKNIGISLESLTQEELINKIQDALLNVEITSGDVVSMYFTKTDLPAGTEIPQTGILGVREFFFISKNRMPPGLLRSLNDQEFLFGFHTFSSKNSAFLILKTSSFENAFSGMLKWEPFIFEDLAPLFRINPSVLQSVQNLSFEDIVVKNTDARALLVNEREALLLYSFVDKETIVIVAHTRTLSEIIDRLKAPKKIIR